MITSDAHPQISPGRILIASNARAQISRQDVIAALRQHLHGKRRARFGSHRSLKRQDPPYGCRLLSVCLAANGITFWMITEPDRSAVKVFLPQDYLAYAASR